MTRKWHWQTDPEVTSARLKSDSGPHMSESFLSQFEEVFCGGTPGVTLESLLGHLEASFHVLEQSGARLYLKERKPVAKELALWKDVLSPSQSLVFEVAWWWSDGPRPLSIACCVWSDKGPLLFLHVFIAMLSRSTQLQLCEATIQLLGRVGGLFNTDWSEPKHQSLDILEKPLKRPVWTTDGKSRLGTRSKKTKKGT